MNITAFVEKVVGGGGFADVMFVVAGDSVVANIELDFGARKKWYCCL
jgi:hypothetical protein